jgi:hypothetical protein
MKKKVINLAVLLLLMVLSTHCNSNNFTDPSEVVFPANNVSYISHVQPFLMLSCGLGGCHSDESRAGNLRVNEYTYVMIEYPGLVAPNLPPEQNLLIQLLDGRVNHFAWNIAERVNQNQLDGLKQWIKEGGLNN